MIIGKCHICQKHTNITFCTLCKHWFCAVCLRKWGGRTIAFIKQLINPVEQCCGPETDQTGVKQYMAKSIEQFVQESLGLLTFQVLMIQAQLEAEKEKTQALQAELDKLKGEKKP